MVTPAKRFSVMARLAEHLQAQQQAVTDQWLLAVRRSPQISSSDRLTHQQLLDHLPQIYRELCDFLRARDAEALQEQIKQEAKKHGGHRWRAGYRLDELLRELDILQRILSATVVTRFGESEADFNGAVEMTARGLMQDFFSELRIESVEQFMEEQQELSSAYTDQLAQSNQQLQEANTALQRVSSQRQRLTNVIAHELRNFVQSLSYATQLWERYPQDLQAHALAQSHIRDIHESLQKLLEHSASIGTPNPLTIEEFDVAEWCVELVAAYETLAQQKGLLLTLEHARAPQTVIGDRRKTKQAIATLLSSAIKSTDSGQVSLVVTAQGEDRWTVSIIDTGSGLSAEACERLIAGAQAADDPALPGRGIGLGITKDLIDLLGGSISLVSTVGQGTRFEVTLPRIIEQPTR